MKFLRPPNIRSRLALWFVAILSSILLIYISAVFVFQYVLLQRQIFHDEIQDVETVEGLLYFDQHGSLQLEQGYHTHQQSRLLEDRLMEVRDLAGNVLYRTDTLKGATLGGTALLDEGVHSYNERSTMLADGTRVLLISHIHPVQGKPVLIRLGYSMVPLHDRMLHFFFLLLLATPIALVAAGFISYSVARRSLRPLASMATRAEQITASNLHDRIAVENPDDELGHMGRVLNHLLERLQQAFGQLQRFTADAAHELRTPLASIRSTGELSLQQDRPDTSYREAISGMLEETTRLNQTIDGLLLLSKAEAVQTDNRPTSFFLPELVQEILALLEVLIEERKITVLEEHENAVHDRSWPTVASCASPSSTCCTTRSSFPRIIPFSASCTVLSNARGISFIASRSTIAVRESLPANTSASSTVSSPALSIKPTRPVDPAWVFPSRGSSSIATVAISILKKMLSMVLNAASSYQSQPRNKTYLKASAWSWCDAEYTR